MGRAKVIPVKIGKAKDDRFCSILDDLYSKSRAFFAKSAAIVGGFLRGKKRGYHNRAHCRGGRFAASAGPRCRSRWSLRGGREPLPWVTCVTAKSPRSSGAGDVPVGHCVMGESHCHGGQFAAGLVGELALPLVAGGGQGTSGRNEDFSAKALSRKGG